MNPTHIREKKYLGMSTEEARQSIPNRIRAGWSLWENIPFFILDSLNIPIVSNNSVVSNIPGRTVP
jgi:hypothetical protein